VAAVTVHLPGGLFATTNGIEIPLLYAAAAVALALTGPGLYSLDARLGFASAWTSELTWSVLGAAAVGAVASLALRRGAQTATATA
jgi:putative oxidoreductase